MTEFSPSRVLLDTNVLFSAGVRDLLLQLAHSQIYEVRWTADIERELVKTYREDKPAVPSLRVERILAVMNAEFPDAHVLGYTHLVGAAGLPDANDEHVLAAARQGGCEAIITFNLRDFPNSILGEFNIAAVHPDEFLLALLEQDVDAFLDAVRAILARLRNPPYSFNEYLALREQDGLVKTVAALRFHALRLA